MVRTERPDRHLGAKVGAADPDVDDVGERPPVPRAVPAGAHVLGEPEEGLPHRLHLGPDPDPVDGDILVRAAAKGHVQRGPPFGRVDGFSGEQGFTPGGEPRGAGEGEEGVERPPVDLLLGEVDEEVFVAERERVEPLRVPLEQGAEGERAQPLSFALDRAPRSGHRIGHAGSPSPLSARQLRPARKVGAPARAAPRRRLAGEG